MEIDYYGRVNGIEPQDFWRHGIKLSDEQNYEAVRRWHDPARIRERQHGVVFIDLRNGTLKQAERKACVSDFDTNNPYGGEVA